MPSGDCSEGRPSVASLSLTTDLKLKAELALAGGVPRRRMCETPFYQRESQVGGKDGAEGNADLPVVGHNP
jgi:hypothetical protein